MSKTPKSLWRVGGCAEFVGVAADGVVADGVDDETQPTSNVADARNGQIARVTILR